MIGAIIHGFSEGSMMTSLYAFTVGSLGKETGDFMIVDQVDTDGDDAVSGIKGFKLAFEGFAFLGCNRIGDGGCATFFNAGNHVTLEAIAKDLL
jgi:hypothetical protein